MYWSGEASTVLAIIGLSSTVYVAYKGEDIRVWSALGYFSLMEALQAYTYLFIDDCTKPQNQIATLLGFIHIVFQPFLINYISLYFIPDVVSKKIQRLVFAVVFTCSVLLLFSIYPFEWGSACSPGSDTICGERLCSISGSWHIAWEIPRIQFWYGLWPYFVAGFILPILYGSWKFTIYHVLTGPAFAFITTNSLNEFPAVWCLYSIGLLLIVAKTPIRQLMFVDRWVFYDHPGSNRKKREANLSGHESSTL